MAAPPPRAAAVSRQASFGSPAPSSATTDGAASAGCAPGIVAMDLQVDLGAKDRYVLRGLDADADLVAHDRQHRYLDVVPDHDALV